MDILAREKRSITILDFRGRLTTGSGANLLINTTRNLICEGKVRMILNFDGLEFMDSTGLGSVVTVAEQVRRQGGRLCILNARDSVRHLLQITRLDAALPNFQEEDAAVASFKL